MMRLCLALQHARQMTSRGRSSFPKGFSIVIFNRLSNVRVKLGQFDAPLGIPYPVKGPFLVINGRFLLFRLFVCRVTLLRLLRRCGPMLQGVLQCHGLTHIVFTKRFGISLVLGPVAAQRPVNVDIGWYALFHWSKENLDGSKGGG